MRVLLVTSDREQCGIRDYGQQLQAHLPAEVHLEEFPHTHPDSLFAFLGCPRAHDVIMVNHHAALHSAWRPEHVQKLQELGYAVVVTQHDTFETASLMADRGFQDFTAADALVVHEQVVGLSERNNVWTLPQGVPVSRTWSYTSYTSPGSGLLGLFGFDFPWKGFDDACRAARLAGWKVRLISPNITLERAAQLQQLAEIEVIASWQSTEKVVRLLSECAATAFLYSCGNSGISGAIRYGLAARRPLIAFSGCRQFRDLEHQWPGDWAIKWASGPEAVALELKRLAGSAFYSAARVAAVEHAALHGSWGNVAELYAEVYHHAVKERNR